MPNHPNKPEMERCHLAVIWIDRADFREEANKQYKRLVLGKEVRLRNAYVIKGRTRGERCRRQYHHHLLYL